jgi:archaellum component FlaC
MEKQV